MPLVNPLIRNPNDLITSYHATCNGFLSQADAKTTKAIPYVGKAKIFSDALKNVNTVNDLLGLKNNYYDEIIAASGFSKKATNILKSSDIDAVVQKVLAAIYTKAGNSFREEILYRYLLTSGDALGGEMRNYTGVMANKKFTEAFLEALRIKRKNIKINKSQNNPEIVQSIVWNDRLLLFNIKPKLINKNVDAVLLNTSSLQHPVQRKRQSSEKYEQEKVKEMLKDMGRYIACGELKGGFDPAGSDEHWKTAMSALERIQKIFSKPTRPKLFFIGTAIEPEMAKELFSELQRGQIDQAANLTVQRQLSYVAHWLAEL